jgi:coenzyme F420-0:L-glutamate ligase / coenzyme F420-1:gamma-L-glutamate ligase
LIAAVALQGVPEIAPGDDLTALIQAALQRDNTELHDGEVVVIAHKAVSKAEGCVRRLDEVAPSARAQQLAEELNKDPRHVQVVLDESRSVLRATRGVMICVTHHGFVCANAGVDASNAPVEGTVILLPRDPDGSARDIRSALQAALGVSPAVLITDSFGRAWRHGQCDVAIGCAGLSPLDDWRGRTDSVGRELSATWIAIGDELAAAADLARTKNGRQPVVLISGAERHVTADDGPGARAVLRPEAEDLFR